MDQKTFNGTNNGKQTNTWSLFSTQVLRRIVQTAVAVFILFIIVQHVVVGENGTVFTPSPEAYCPFGGLETMFKYLTNGGTFVSHTHLSNIVVFIAVLVISLLFRSAFCGWICPLGFIQDLTHKLSVFIQTKFPALRRSMITLKKKSTWARIVDRYLRYLKYLVLIWSIGGAAVYGYMVFRDFDPWSALINIAEFSFTPGFIVLIVLLLASLFVERPWCRYACPLGAFNGLIGKLSPFYLKREESVCISCKLCSNACPMGLNVHSAATITHADCMSCLECVGSCPKNGALEVKLGIPLTGK